MYALAQSTANHAAVNHTELEISIQDVRMAMQDCAALAPEKMLVDQEFDGEEDTRGVDAFLAWAMGKVNREIRRVALEGGDGLQEDYLAGTSSREVPFFTNIRKSSRKSTVLRMRIRDILERFWESLRNLEQSRLRAAI
jgi:hypothetical protein